MKTYGIIEIKNKINSAYNGKMFRGFGIYILYKYALIFKNNQDIFDIIYFTRGQLMKLTLNRKTTEDFEEYVKLNKDTIQLNALNNTLSFYLYENSDFDISDLFKYIMEFDFQNNDNIQDIIEDYDFETEDKNQRFTTD